MPNKFQLKRTTVSGRTANTTNNANNAFLDKGELAVNLADRKVFSSDVANNLFEVGANLSNLSVTTSATLKNDVSLNFETLNGNNITFRQQADDNFVFYTTNTAGGQRAVWSIFANSVSSNLRISTQTTFNGNVDLNIVALYANGSPGTAGQVLTSNGQSTYWQSIAAIGTNVNATYAWTNTHSFAANVSFGNNISITSGNSSVGGGLLLFNGLADGNWKIGRNTNDVTKWYYTNNTLDILAANSNLEGIVFGNPLDGGTTYIETGHAGTFIAGNVTIGNTSSKSTINSTTFSGTANNASFLGGNSASDLRTYTDNRAANAYSNATVFAANASNANNGTLAEARLPFRMDQNVRTIDNVEFVNVTVTGNITVSGTQSVIGGNNLSITDNMIYLNQGSYSPIANISGNGSVVTFTANNNYSAGWDVFVSGVNPSSYNGTYQNILAANDTHFQVSNTNTASYVSGGTARGKSDQNPDLGFAFGYNDGTYHHGGFFRDASDGIFKVFDNYGPEPDDAVFIDTANSTFRIANFQAATVYLGNTSVYGTINTTSFSGTANNATNFGGSSLATIQGQITGNAATAYTNAVSYTDAKIDTANTAMAANAATAYSNAVTYTDTRIGTANTAMVANAGAAYTNAITIAANATNLTSGTVAFARLPSLFLGTTAIQSTSAAQAVSGITTLAAGNTTITGFANVTGNLTATNPIFNNIKHGYSTTATAAGTTILTSSSNYQQFFTGTTTQVVSLPAPQTMTLGQGFLIVNNSTGSLEVRAANAAVVITVLPGMAALCVSIDLTAGNGAAGWSAEIYGFSGATGTGNVVLANSPTITGTLSAGTLAAGNTTITGFANVTSTIQGGSSLTIAGAASGITTLAAGNTTITGFANVSTTLQVGTNTATFGTAAYIVANGNVGIGTSSPSAALTVGGVAGGDRTIQIGSAGATRGVISTDGTNGLVSIGATNDSTTGILSFKTGSALTEAMRIVANGNVGIGRSTPAGKLHVYDASGSITPLIVESGSGVDTTRGIAMDVDGSNYGRILVPSGSGGAMAFWTGSANAATERMRVAANGNVGIGTSAPTDLFVVDGGVFSVNRYAGTGAMNLQRAEGTKEVPTAINAAAVPISLINMRAYDGTSAYRSAGMIRLNSAGPITPNSSPGTLTLLTTPDGSVTPLTRMQISSNGNIGIGTTAPTSLLVVNGTVALGNTTITGFANVANTLQVSGISTFSGNVVLGTSGLSANGGFGTAGHTLHSNGTATYWAADDNTTYDLLAVANTAVNAGLLRLSDSSSSNDTVTFTGTGTSNVSSNATHIVINSADQFVGTVTSVATANGLSGGPITTSGTLGVTTGSTLTVNTTGIHVNSALSIATLATTGVIQSNNTIAIYYGANDNFSTGFNVYKRGNTADANGSIATNAELGYNSFYGYNGTTYRRGAYFLAQATEAWSNTALGTRVQFATTPNGSNTSSVRLTLEQNGDVTIGGNILGGATVNATSLTVGSNFIANTTRVAIGTAVGLQANGGIGTAGQVLHSNGTSIYWAADDDTNTTYDLLAVANTAVNAGLLRLTDSSSSNDTVTFTGAGTSNVSSNATHIIINSADQFVGTVTSVATGNGLSGGTITTSGTLGVTTGNTLTVNTAGIHVNSALSLTSLALSGDLTVSGNLTVSGTRTYVNTTTLDIGDNIFTLNADLGATAPSENAGLEIMRGTSANVQFVWDETNDRWTTNGQPIAVSSLVAGGAASGITTLAAGNTTITGFANVTSTIQGGSSLTIAGALSGVTTAAMGNTTITGFANVSTTLQVGTNTATFGTAAYVVANGNVGIGTASPAVKLDVNGAIQFGGTAGKLQNESGFGTLRTTSSMRLATDANGIDYSAAGYGHTWYINSVQGMFLDGSRNLSIGNTSPSYKLDVFGGDIRLANNATYIRAVTSSGATVRMLGINAANDAYVGPIDPGPISTIFNASNTSTIAAFYTSGTEKMRISSGGNISVGQTATPARFTSQTSTFGEAAAASNNVPFYGKTFGGTTTAPRNLFVGHAYTGNATARADMQLLFVNSNDSSAISGALVYTNDGAITIRNNGESVAADTLTGTEYMRVAANGNIGVGNTAPANKLFVTGDIGLDGISVRDTATLTTTATTQTTLVQYPTATYNTGELTIQAVSNGVIHTTKMLVVCNTTVAIATEYGSLLTGSSLYTVDCDISGSNTRIRVTPATTVSTAFKASYELITA